ncbi:MAG: cupin domain-containing protein [Sumerlaeia bacterium]
MSNAKELIRQLQLSPHPEGGYYREVFRSENSVLPLIEQLQGGTPTPPGEKRSSMTSIFFLLEKGDFSAFHQVKADEVWQLILGGPAEIFSLTSDGELQHSLLAVDQGAGFNPQCVIKAGRLQATRLAPNAEFALCTCIVAPGFEFKDFYMPTRQEMLAILPQHKEMITQLTRES